MILLSVACLGGDRAAPVLTDTGTTDSAVEEPPACEGEGVTFFPDSGEAVDLTDAFTTGEATVISEDGVLVVCPGTWFVQLWLEDAEVSVVGSGVSDTILSGGEQYPVITAVGPGSFSVSAVTIERGNAEGPANYSTGGGLRCWRASCEVSNAAFVNNHAFDGSAISVSTDESSSEQTTLAVSDTTFSNNLADDDGTVTINNNCVVTMDRVTFSNNSARDGGAISILGGGTLRFSSGSFVQNSAIGFGGALFVLGGQLSISDSVFSGNTADRGGAVMLSEGGKGADASLFYDTVFQDNIAADSGGAIYRYTASPVIGTGVEFSGNAPEDISSEGSPTSFEATVDFVCEGSDCQEGT